MKQVYVAKDTFDAQAVSAALESAGIKTRLHGEHLANIRGEVPFDLSTAPSVWVLSDEDAETARQYVREFVGERPRASGESWTCAGCGEQLEPQFTHCWNCAKERGT